MDELSYPGCLLDEELSYRVMKCYVFNFAPDRITRRPRYDKVSGKPTEKKYFWFNISRPMRSAYHSMSNRIRFTELMRSNFIQEKPSIFFTPHYAPKGQARRHKSFVYLCSGRDFIDYLNEIDGDAMQNFIVFDSSFKWAVDFYEDLVPEFSNHKDVVIYFKKPNDVSSAN